MEHYFLVIINLLLAYGILMILILSVISSACAVRMAANAPNKKDVKVLSIRNHRDLLLAGSEKNSIKELDIARHLQRT